MPPLMNASLTAPENSQATKTFMPIPYIWWGTHVPNSLSPVTIRMVLIRLQSQAHPVSLTVEYHPLLVLCSLESSSEHS